MYFSKVLLKMYPNKMMSDYNYNIYVFTTKFVVKEKSPIVHVTHDKDGDWQFLGAEENISESDAMIVSLGEIIQIDESIVKVLDMPEGKDAVRGSINDKWEFE